MHDLQINSLAYLSKSISNADINNKIIWNVIYVLFALQTLTISCVTQRRCYTGWNCITHSRELSALEKVNIYSGLTEENLPQIDSKSYYSFISISLSVVMNGNSWENVAFASVISSSTIEIFKECCWYLSWITDSQLNWNKINVPIRTMTD